MVASFADIMFGLLAWILLVAGYGFTTGLLLVPCCRLKALWDAEEGLDHLPLMYWLSLLNSLTWAAYACLPPPPLKYSVLIISVIGAFVQIVYLIWCICICAHPAEKIFIVFLLTILLIPSGIIAWLMSVSHGWIFGGPNSLDTFATITSILMYLGPLADTATAIYTRDPARMSVPIMLVSFGNAFANELGMISPAIQIAVYVVLRWNESPAMKQAIAQFFAPITGFLSAYILLRPDENEEDDA
ncbi:unnamed protein product [Alopecurus aequalis]